MSDKIDVLKSSHWFEGKTLLHFLSPLLHPSPNTFGKTELWLVLQRLNWKIVCCTYAIIALQWDTAEDTAPIEYLCSCSHELYVYFCVYTCEKTKAHAHSLMCIKVISINIHNPKPHQEEFFLKIVMFSKTYLESKLQLFRSDLKFLKVLQMHILLFRSNYILSLNIKIDKILQVSSIFSSFVYIKNSKAV